MTLNKTKIIATLGPSSTEKSMLKTLIEKGVNVFRVNFSHANHDEVKNTVLNIQRNKLVVGSSCCNFRRSSRSKNSFRQCKRRGCMLKMAKALFSITTNATIELVILI